MSYAQIYRVTPDQLTLDTAPVAEPVTLAEMKLHCRVDHDDDDTILTAQIQAAREWIERQCNLSMVQRTYTASLPRFVERIELPRRPVIAVSAIQYWSTDSPSSLLTLDTSKYRVNEGEGYLYRNYSESWPSVDCRHDAIQITYTAGHAPNSASPVDHAANVPEALKQALKLLVADMYELREETITGTIVSARGAVKALLDPYWHHW